MAWGPVRAAAITLDAEGVAHAPDFDDVYHARGGALAQARHVFLAGNGLPQRWGACRRFVVLETGFGLGNNFLATWAAWRADAARCERLWFISIEKHPPTATDLARALARHAGDRAVEPLAQALLAAWPPATPDLHSIDFDGGRVRLLLGLGDIAQVLPELVATVDAFYLDGFAPARNPAMWDARHLQALNRLAAPGATVATWSVAATVRMALRHAGFEVTKAAGFGDKREMTQGRFVPRHVPAAPPGRRGQPLAREVVVIGAGLAGAAAARALAAQGLSVQVLEALDGPAQAGSGNPGGLLHGIVHAHDGPHARWLRAAALHAQRVLAPLVAQGLVPGKLDGLLRGAPTMDPTAMLALLADQGLPSEYVQVHSPATRGPPAGEPADAANSGAAWLYPGAGWISPAALVAHWLAAPGITLRTGCRAETLVAQGAHWQVLDAHGHVLAEADAIVLANAHDAQRLLAALALPPWPTRSQRGQTTVLPAGLPGMPTLHRPVAAGAYALRLADGRLLCGATRQLADDDATLRATDHAENLDKLARLTGWTAPLAAADPRISGRVGWRFSTDDRLPLVGPVPLPRPLDPRLTRARRVPRVPGLWLLSALGSRGLTQATLAGELLAAWLSEAPWPVPADLVDAVDPARFVARVARRPSAARPPAARP